MAEEAGTAQASPETKEEERPTASPLREIPAAMKGRWKIIHSENPEVSGVLVKRWSIEKSMLIIPEIFAMWGELPEKARLAAYKVGGEMGKGGEANSAAQAMAMLDIATIAVEHCWKRMIYLIRLSVEEADRDKVGDMDMDEAIDLVEGILEVNPNLIPKLKKKGPQMLKRFAPLFGGNKKSTP